MKAGWSVLLLVVAGCVPRVHPLTANAMSSKVPPVELPRRPMQLRFTWTYADESFRANGDGAVRVSPPNRARLDFFLQNGSAGGSAVLEKDSLYLPGATVTRRVLPPPALLWAALGRLSLPSVRDTVVRADGDTLRVDLGMLPDGDVRKAVGAAWRLTFGGNRLARVERIERGKIVEWISRRRGADGETIRYNHETGKRRLTIVVTDTTWVEGFDEAIWHHQ